MSAIGTAYDHRTPVADDDRRRLPLGPAEGWTSVLLLVVMAALTGFLIRDEDAASTIRVQSAPADPPVAIAGD